MKLSPDNKLKLYLGEYRGQGTERWRLLLCTFPQEWQENKTGFVLLLQLHTGWIPGDICSGIPAHTPERLWHSSSEIERLINVPMTALGLKKKKQQLCVCTCAYMLVRVHHPHNMLYVISTQPPVYMKGVNKHHMNSNKAHPQSTHTSSSWSVHCSL